MNTLIGKTFGLCILLSCASACSDTLPVSDTEPENIAKQTVADFLSISADMASLVSVDARNFNDSSLGCPVAGMAYQQVITPGYKIVIEAEGRRFDVRVAGSSGRICRNGLKGKTQKVSLPPLPDQNDVADRARRDLAIRLNIDASAITLTSIRPYKGSALSGCNPKCAQTDSCGYIVKLDQDGRTYTYFANDEIVQACPPIAES